MKIIWLNNFKLGKDKEKGELIGGAEITISKHVEYLTEQGIDVKVMTHFDHDREEIKKADLVILSNINMDKNPIKGFKVEDMDWVINNKDYVTFQHDAQFHPLRNPYDLKTFNPGITPFWHREMFKKSKLNIFLSPLQLKPHLKFFWKELGSEKYINANHKEISDWEKDWSNEWEDLINDSVVCIPPVVKKSEMFASEDARQEGTYCSIGAIYPGKGVEDILENYESLGKNLRFIGSRANERLAIMIEKKGHTVVPAVDYKEMSKVLQKYQYMIISRRIKLVDNQGRFVMNEDNKHLYFYMYEGFGRIIPEALNCGVNIIVEDDSKEVIGCFSYNWTNEEIMDNCDTADSLLYNTLKGKNLFKEVVEK